MKTKEQIDEIHTVAVIVLLMLLSTLLACSLWQEQNRSRERKELIDYWHSKTDSLMDENIAIRERYWALKDSLMTIKYNR